MRTLLAMRSAPDYEQLPAEARRHVARGNAELIYNPYATSTWRIDRPQARPLYLKAAQVGVYPTLAGERDRCLWLASRGVPVPEVVDHGSDGTVEWLVTVALAGTPAIAPEYLRNPRRTVPVLAEGLRAFHETDPSGCPFDYRIPTAIAHATRRVAGGGIDPAGFHEIHRHLDPGKALAHLQALRPDDEPDVVVCHGDYCCPNVLLEGQRVVGYIDLGEVGLADRWRDLAVATWSVTWNFGPGHEDRFLGAYGTDWDIPRRDFYRLLYDLEA